MKLIHAALLLHSAGKDVTEDSVRSVVDAAGIDAEDAEIKALVSALEDVDIEEAMNTAVSAGAPAAAPAPQESEAAEEEAAEEEEEDDEAAEEEAAEGLGSLFG